MYIQKRKIIFSFLFLIGTAFPGLAQSDTVRQFHIGLVYPLSTNGTQAPEYTNGFSAHAVGGVSANEKSLTLSGVANVILRDASGLQAAGTYNYIKRHASGVELAGAVNHIGGHARGLQAAGAVNLSRHTRGAQVAGAANMTDSLTGFQIGGAVNKAGVVKGSQVAGLVNIARSVSGVQIAGLLNIADSSDYAIAVVNLIKNGEKAIGITTDETFNLVVSFRSGGRVLYGILGAGYNLKSEQDLFAFEGGIGAHLLAVESFRIKTELSSLNLTDFKKGWYSKAVLRLMPSWKAGERIEVFAGPTLNFTHYTHGKGADLRSGYFGSGYSSGGNRFHGWHVGAAGGIQYVM